MALRLGKVLNVVSKVATTANQLDSASNYSFLPKVTSVMKGSGLDFLSVNNLLGAVTGIDLQKYLTIDNLTKVLNLDVDLSNIMPSSLNLGNLGGKDLSLDSIEDKFSNLKMPDLSSITSGMDVSSLSEKPESIFSSLSSEVSGALASVDIGSTDLLSPLGFGTSLF